MSEWKCNHLEEIRSTISVLNIQLSPKLETKAYWMFSDDVLSMRSDSYLFYLFHRLILLVTLLSVIV